MNWFNKIWRKLKYIISHPKPFRTKLVQDMPETARKNTLYLVGENDVHWFAAMQSPCGCKAKIQLSLLPNDKPNWSAIIHDNKTASLHPSVWRKVGCKSHFWFKNGIVHWCK